MRLKPADFKPPMRVKAPPSAPKGALSTLRSESTERVVARLRRLLNLSPIQEDAGTSPAPRASGRRRLPDAADPTRRLLLGGGVAGALALADQAAAATLFLKGGRPPGVAAPPQISAESVSVVGEYLHGEPGVYPVEPVSRAYKWRRGGVDIDGADGLQYLQVDDDASVALGGQITFVEIVTAVGGAVTETVSAPRSKPRRTYPTMSVRYGADSPVNVGRVAVTNATMKGAGLMYGAGAAAPSSCIVGVATTGNDTHFSKTALQTPRVSSAGKAAGLSGTYAWPLTHIFPDGATELSTLEYVIVPNVITWGGFDGGLGGSEGTNPNSLYAISGGLGASGKAFEIATGTDTSGGFDFRDWKFSTDTIIRPADPTRWGLSRNVTFRGCDNFVFQYLKTAGAVPSSNCVYMTNSYLGGGADKSGRVVVRNWTHKGLPGLVSGTYAARTQNVTHPLFEDCDLEWVMGGWNDDSAGNLTWRRCGVRYFHDNCWIVGASTDGPTHALLEDCYGMSPMRQAGNTTHLDLVQGSGVMQAGSTVRIRRTMFHQADGDAVCQGVFCGSQANILWEIDGYMYAGWVNWAVGVASAAIGSFFKNLTLVMTTPRPYSTASTEDDSYNDNGPTIYINGVASNWANGIVIDNVLMHRAPQYSTTPPEAALVAKIVATNAYFGAGTEASPEQFVGYLWSPPKPILDAQPYESMTVAQILAHLTSVCTPRSDAPVKGARTPTGEWAVAA